MTYKAFFGNSEAPAAAALDDGESSPSWPHPLGVDVALRLGAAALALSATLAHGIQQQADELPRATLLAGQENIQVVAIGNDSLPSVFSYDDDIVPEPVQPALEEGTWASDPGRARAAEQPPWGEDELPRVALDEDGWTASWTQTGPRAGALLADEEIFPQAAEPGLDEPGWMPEAIGRASFPLAWSVEDELPRVPLVPGDESWQVIAIGEVEPAVVFVVDDDIVPQPAATTGFDDGEWIHAALPQRAVVQLWSETDDLPAVAAFEDDTWQAQVAAARPAAQPEHAVDDIVPQPSDIVDEDYWLPLLGTPVEVVIYDIPPTGGFGAPPPEVSVVEEDYWTPPFVAQRRAFIGLLHAQDELPPAALEYAPMGGAGQRAILPSTILSWAADDELPVAATPLNVQDDEWVPGAVRSRPSILPQPATDEIARLQISEEYWHEPTWLTRPAFLYVPIGEDERPTPAVPLNVTEEYWQEPTWRRRLPFLCTPIGEDEWPTPALPIVTDEGEWELHGVRLQLKRPLYLLYLPGGDDFAVAPADYDWDPRGRLGSERARDRWQRIGSERARDSSERIGSQSAHDAAERVGSERARDVLERIGSSSAKGRTGRIGGDKA